MNIQRSLVDLLLPGALGLHGGKPGKAPIQAVDVEHLGHEDQKTA